MTQKAVSFKELMEGVLDQLRANGYMESTITIYRRTYTRIRVFLNRFDTDFYTPEIGTKFLAETNVKKSTASAYACAIRRLNDFIDSKPFRSHHDCHHVQAPPEFASILEKFLQECMDNGNKPATLQGKERTCGIFLDYLKRTGCTDISRLDTGMVSRSLLTFSNKDRYAVLRQFLRFLADEGITEMDLSGIVPHYRRRKPLPTTYTPEEIARVEAVVDTSTDTGKRNLAIIQLATRMGLRSGDIAKLKLTEIDFGLGIINITQEKTGLPVSLKMPSDVYDTLAAHVKNDIRTSADGYVFHCMVAPYGRISTSIIRHAVNDSFSAAKVDTAGKKHGPHAFRSSLASSMVNDGTPYEVVRRILGHSDPDVIRHYAKVDIENLRMCSIDPPVPTGRFGKYLSGKEVVPRV